MRETRRPVNADDQHALDELAQAERESRPLLGPVGWFVVAALGAALAAGAFGVINATHTSTGSTTGVLVLLSMAMVLAGGAMVVGGLYLGVVRLGEARARGSSASRRDVMPKPGPVMVVERSLRVVAAWTAEPVDEDASAVLLLDDQGELLYINDYELDGPPMTPEGEVELVVREALTIVSLAAEHDVALWMESSGPVVEVRPGPGGVPWRRGAATEAWSVLPVRHVDLTKAWRECVERAFEPGACGDHSRGPA